MGKGKTYILFFFFFDIFMWTATWGKILKYENLMKIGITLVNLTKHLSNNKIFGV